jgi:hypothetical protein
MTLREYEKKIAQLQQLPDFEVMALNQKYGELGVHVTPKLVTIADVALRIGEAQRIHSDLTQRGFKADAIQRFSNGEAIGTGYVFDSGIRHSIDVCAAIDNEGYGGWMPITRKLTRFNGTVLVWAVLGAEVWLQPNGSYPGMWIKTTKRHSGWVLDMPVTAGWKRRISPIRRGLKLKTREKMTMTLTIETDFDRKAITRLHAAQVERPDYTQPAGTELSKVWNDGQYHYELRPCGFLTPYEREMLAEAEASDAS